jgi:hypothetical protein
MRCAQMLFGPTYAPTGSFAGALTTSSLAYDGRDYAMPTKRIGETGTRGTPGGSRMLPWHHDGFPWRRREPT